MNKKGQFLGDLILILCVVGLVWGIILILPDAIDKDFGVYKANHYKKGEKK